MGHLRLRVLSTLLTDVLGNQAPATFSQTAPAVLYGMCVFTSRRRIASCVNTSSCPAWPASLPILNAVGCAVGCMAECSSCATNTTCLACTSTLLLVSLQSPSIDRYRMVRRFAAPVTLLADFARAVLPRGLRRVRVASGPCADVLCLRGGCPAAGNQLLVRRFNQSSLRFGRVALRADLSLALCGPVFAQPRHVRLVRCGRRRSQPLHELPQRPPVGHSRHLARTVHPGCDRAARAQHHAARRQPDQPAGDPACAHPSLRLR